MDASIWTQFSSKFMQDPVANTRALWILVALIASLVISVLLVLRDKPLPTGRSWYTALVPAIVLLAVPAAWDLLKTEGIALLYARILFACQMLLSALPLLVLWGQPKLPWLQDSYRWAVPILGIAGLAISIYLAFIEATQARPVCGPVGDCGAVQDSPYATLFGFLPVGVLGVIGVVSILIAWLVQQFGPQPVKKLATIALWGMCVFGVLFSTYLTFLEPFVIGASCMWCLNSAVVMILFLWVSTPSAQKALSFQEIEIEVALEAA